MLDDQNVALEALRQANPVIETDAIAHEARPDRDRAQLSALLDRFDGAALSEERFARARADLVGQRCGMFIGRGRRPER
jgi:hypothetical protein